MIENDKKIRKGMSASRDPICYQVQQDILIPAGTILRDDKNGEYRAALGGMSAALVFTAIPGAPVPAAFKRVIA